MATYIVLAILLFVLLAVLDALTGAVGKHGLKLLAARVTTRGYPRCAHCHYDLTGHLKDSPQAGERCPECGHVLEPNDIYPAGQPDPHAVQRWQLLAFRGAAVFIGVFAVILMIRYRYFNQYSVIGLLVAIVAFIVAQRHLKRLP